MLLESDSGATILLGPLMALCKLLATLLRYLNKVQIKDPLLREPMNQPVTGNSNIVKMPESSMSYLGPMRNGNFHF